MNIERRAGTASGELCTDPRGRCAPAVLPESCSAPPRVRLLNTERRAASVTAADGAEPLDVVPGACARQLQCTAATGHGRAQLNRRARGSAPPEFDWGTAARGWGPWGLADIHHARELIWPPQCPEVALLFVFNRRARAAVPVPCKC